MGQSDISIAVPAWVSAFEAACTGPFPTSEARMALAVDLSRQNITERTGGPFGAAVFDLATGQLVAVGVNLVTSANCSLAHAEMVAIARTQQRLNAWNLAAKGRFELATSCAPCAMCLGAVPWSGVCSLLCGARDGDARAIGFDEGAKPADWARQLQNRGIAVAQDILRDPAVTVLRAYAVGGGIIY
jgi:tRNA(Arg) A34 adenosine deaminase TadA